MLRSLFSKALLPFSRLGAYEFEGREARVSEILLASTATVTLTQDSGLFSLPSLCGLPQADALCSALLSPFSPLLCAGFVVRSCAPAAIDPQTALKGLGEQRAAAFSGRIRLWRRL